VARRGALGVLLLGLAAAALTGCAPEGGAGGPGGGRPPGADSDGSDSGGRPSGPVGRCAADDLQVLHVEAWPGRGVGLLVRGAAPGGAPHTDARDAALPDAGLTLTTARGAPLTARVAPAPAPPLRLAVVVADPALRPALAALLAGLPADARAALYRACQHSDQVAGFGARRGRLLRALADDRLWPGTGGCDPAPERPLADALSGPAADVVAVGNAAEPALRVVLWAGPAEGELPAVEGGVRVLAAGDAAALAALPDTLAAAGTGLVRVAVCAPLADHDVLVLARADDPAQRCAVPAPRWPPEEDLLPCAAADIAAGARAHPRRVELRFDAAQRAVYEDRLAHDSKAEFALRVRLGAAEPVAARARLRGQSSLPCARRNYTVDLDEPALRHVLPGLATDEFHLLSMCLDDRYHQQLVAGHLARPLGLFLSQAGLVELSIDGAPRGVYLLLEKGHAAARDELARPRVLLRRRFDADGVPPDVKLPAGATEDDPALAPWRALHALADVHGGAALVAALDERLELDAFLGIVALHSVLGNGDWADETYFFSEESVLADGAGGLPTRGERFGAATWDMDDLYSACHHQGRFAMPDEHGLLFCSEGLLEQAVLTDPAVYARFVDVLEGLLADGLGEADMDAALAATAAELLPFFADPAVCAAMTELTAANPAAVRPEVAQADIRAHMDALREDFRARRAELLARIAAYREGR
jgi:hypothetical protein